MYLTDQATNQTSKIPFTHYNDDGCVDVWRVTDLDHNNDNC